MDSEKIIPEKEVLAVKILAEYSDTNRYVYMVFFIDKYDGKIIDYTFIISGSFKLLKFLDTYTDFIELYKHIKIHNKLNNDGSKYFAKFEKIMNNIFSDSKNVNSIVIYSNNNNMVSITDIFENPMNRFMDFHIGKFDVTVKTVDIDNLNAKIEEIKTEIENIDALSNTDNQDENSQDQSSEEQPEEQKPTYKLINASFIVDPISGKSINDIEAGNKVMVSINSNTVEENIIYLELKGKKDQYSKYIVPAEVLEKTVEEKSIKILLKLIEGYCCLIEEEEPIKLKVYNPEKDIAIPNEGYISNTSNKKKSSFISDKLPKINTFKLAIFGLSLAMILVFSSIVYVFFLQD